MGLYEMSDRQGSGWQKEVTRDLEDNLLKAAHACMNNANTLLDDANLLLSNNRYARATALAVLSMEECGKALHLIFCITRHEWNSEIYKGISQHNTKQTYVEGVLNLVEALLDRPAEIAALMSQNPSMNDMYSSLEPLKDSAMEVVKKTHKKPELDKLKQHAFYVGVTKDARISSEPKSISEDQSKTVLLRAERIRYFAKIQVASYASEDHRKLYENTWKTQTMSK